MSNIKHDVFVKKIKSILSEDTNRKNQQITSLDDLFEEEADDTCSDDIMKELEKKFDELFGAIDDLNSKK